MQINVQETIKAGGRGASIFILRVATGLFIGLTMALIFQKLFELGVFSFTGVIMFFVAGFVRISRGWQMTSVLIFNLFCIMVGLLLRMYIVFAPGE